MRNLIAIAATLALALALVGCGDDDTPSAGEARGSAPDGNANMAEQYPSCSEVWEAGALLPDDYAGCKDGDTVVDLASTPCEDGEASLQIHQTAAGKNTFIAITGQAIQPYADEADADLYAQCRPSNAGN